MDSAPYPDFDGTQPCAEYETDLFFPLPTTGPSGGLSDMHPAIAVCRRCPFIRPCLAYATTHDVHGIWGGTFASERDRMRKQSGIRADRTGLSYSDTPTNEQVLNLSRGGATVREIAEHFGMTYQAIYERLKDQGAQHAS